MLVFMLAAEYEGEVQSSARREATLPADGQVRARSGCSRSCRVWPPLVRCARLSKEWRTT